MNLNRKKHKTLELLSVSRIQFESGEMDSETKFGVSFEDLQSELNCDRKESELVFSTLYSNEEIEYTNVDVEGLISTRKGLTSFSEKKYLKENNKIIVNWFRNFVQIVIPILSLSIAFLALSIKINDINSKTSKEIKAIELKLESIQNSINKSEMKTKNIQTDSLIIE